MCTFIILLWTSLIDDNFRFLGWRIDSHPGGLSAHFIRMSNHRFDLLHIPVN